MDPGTALSVEEQRLGARLPRNDDPARLQSDTFAHQMIAGAGFEGFRAKLAGKLCSVESASSAKGLLRTMGTQLWHAAVNRAQAVSPADGALPASDDRPLYWTRLQATATVRQWQPNFALDQEQRAALITTFDKASRGMFDIAFPAGKHVTRVLVSGFDPYTLDGGQDGTAEGAAGNNIRHGNPSGALALALDGTFHTARDGTRQLVEAYTLPVNYTEFRAGYLEDTVGPYLTHGPRQADASITISQAGGDQFNLEQYNGRYHGPYPGNDYSQPCPALGQTPQLAIDNHGCNIRVVPRWGGPETFALFDPPQWTSTSLPIGPMIAADTGRTVPRPPGDTWPDPAEAFGVVWHTNYTEFPDCSSSVRLSRNNPPPRSFPPPSAPVPPDEGSCSYSGGGGNYLSNESAYRNTLLRDRMGADIPAGHIHTPDMQHFGTGSLYLPSDSTFDEWRNAIVQQGRNLVLAVGTHSS